MEFSSSPLKEKLKVKITPKPIKKSTFEEKSFSPSPLKTDYVFKNQELETVENEEEFIRPSIWNQLLDVVFSW